MHGTVIIETDKEYRPEDPARLSMFMARLSGRSHSYFFNVERHCWDGVIVFDLLTDECMTHELLYKWVASAVTQACSMTPKKVAIDYFAGQGFRYVGGFIAAMAPGLTEYFVFKK